MSSTTFDMFADEAGVQSVASASTVTLAPEANPAPVPQYLDTAPDDDAAGQERKVPEQWTRMLGSIPEAFRPPILQGCWKIHDDVLQAHADSGPDRLGHLNLGRNSAEMTAMCHVSYAMFLPYHLVKPEQMEQALSLLGEDLHKFRTWIRGENPTADRVLVIGDMPQEKLVHEELEYQLDKHPALVLCCGPGKGVEAIVRSFGDANNFVTANVTSVDREASGANWEQVPGASLDKLVARLFNELKPDRVFAFDPVRMPSTLLVLAEAQKRRLPVLYSDGPSVRKPVSP